MTIKYRESKDGAEYFYTFAVMLFLVQVLVGIIGGSPVHLA